jgi:hypothetical protein
LQGLLDYTLTSDSKKNYKLSSCIKLPSEEFARTDLNMTKIEGLKVPETTGCRGLLAPHAATLFSCNGC